MRDSWRRLYLGVSLSNLLPLLSSSLYLRLRFTSTPPPHHRWAVRGLRDRTEAEGIAGTRTPNPSLNRISVSSQFQTHTEMTLDIGDQNITKDTLSNQLDP